MKQVFIQKGNAIVGEVPSPEYSDDEVLVKVHYSCISTGTETHNIKASGRSIYQKVMERPQEVKKVFKTVREQGLKSGVGKAKVKIDAKNPIGYSASGIVIKAGKNINALKPGDMVACAGDGIAVHAEFIAVPENLAVKIPESLSAKEASTAALGSIAVQGVRRCSPGLGDRIAVIGLGAIGQLTVQLLGISGCRVIGIDLDKNRLNAALKSGLEKGLDPGKADVVKEVLRATDGYGADSVIITATTADPGLINQAVRMCRKRGKLVIVGNVRMDIEREEFYRRELDLVISTSYGPGRYDYNFEHKNLDYPFPYVRWTENRNMKEYLQLLSENKVGLDNIIGTIYKIEDAPEAYKALLGGKKKPLLTLLEYDKGAKPAQKMIKKSFKPVSGKIKTGIIGAGNFTKSIHLPNLSKLGDLFSIHAVCSKTGSNSDSLAGQYGAKYSTTDYKDVLKDKDIDLVFISTRHDLHAKMAAEAAEAGKAVFLEKPAALDLSGLNGLVKAVESKKTPFLVGFNRRFSPFSLKIKETISGRTNPLMIYYRVNAGFIPKDSWVHSGEGGGRNIGEACHFYDLFNYFTGSTVESIKASGITPGTEQYNSNDNFTAAIKYKDGSVCSLLYTALGNESITKEKMEIYFDQKVLILEDFLTLDIYDPEKSGMRSRVQDKGLLNELKEFGKSIKEGEGYPIPLWQIIQATEISFEIEKQIRM